jgi:hypothetical protein
MSRVVEMPASISMAWTMQYLPLAVSRSSAAPKASNADASASLRPLG